MSPIHVHTCSSVECSSAATMAVSSLNLLICGVLAMVASFPVAVVGFCSTAAVAAAAGPSLRQLRTRNDAATPATTSTRPTNDLSDGDNDSSSSSNHSSTQRFENFAEFLIETQKQICAQAEASDGKATFCTDRWEREGDSKVWLLVSRCRGVSFCARLSAWRGACVSCTVVNVR